MTAHQNQQTSKQKRIRTYIKYASYFRPYFEGVSRQKKTKNNNKI